MAWVTTLWSMAAAAALTLGWIHLGVWLHERKSVANLFFSIIAFAVAGIALTEVGMMHSASPQEWGEWLRWFHLPLFFAITGIVLFVRIYFGTGRKWLAWLIVGIRCVVLVSNFAAPPNFTFREIRTLARLPFLGEQVATVGEAVLNPFQFLGTTSVLLLALFVVDATVALWRKRGNEERHKAITVGGGIIAFLVLSLAQTQLMLWGFFRMPVLVSPPFLITVATMGWELSRDILVSRRAQRESEELRREVAHSGRVTMLGQLASALAHELNQPLTSILSNAQAAQKFLSENPAQMDEVRETLNDIVGEGRRAGEIIRRIRAMLKKGVAKMECHDLNATIRDVLVIVRSDLVARNVSVTVEHSPRLPLVNGDHIQLQQVMLNLIMNGCDAMIDNPPDKRLLTIETECNGSGLVKVSVADQGAGIAPELLEQVFEPFYTTKVKGLGLGLPLCRSIITAHGGRLWASNRQGRGAVFHFTIGVAGGRANSDQ